METQWLVTWGSLEKKKNSSYFKEKKNRNLLLFYYFRQSEQIRKSRACTESRIEHLCSHLETQG